MVWSDDAYDNKNITPTLSGIEAKYELANMTTVTFTVTFSYKNSSNTKNPVLNSIINYQFVPNAEDAAILQLITLLANLKKFLTTIPLAVLLRFS